MIQLLKDFWNEHWGIKLIMSLILAFVLWMGWEGWKWYDALSLKTGVVIGRGHSDAWDQLQFIQCGDVQVPMWTHWPEVWSVTIEGDDWKGVHKKRTISVQLSDWYKMEEGTTWTFE